MPGENNWEILPLPADYAQTMYCGFNPPSGYTIDPRDPNPADPANSGHHNHKGFSVYAQGDSILWAGTANGINKGIINGNCIDWIGHYSSWQNNISGNWIIGFAHQEFNSYTRVWAITWNADSQGEFSALSYTDDDGENWNITSPSGNSEQVYNLCYQDYNNTLYHSQIYRMYYFPLPSFHQSTWEEFSDLPSFLQQPFQHLKYPRLQMDLSPIRIPNA